MRTETLYLEFDERLLLSRLKEDDKTAFAAIVRHCTPSLFLKACKLTKNKYDAEDLLQDLFADLWDKRHQLVISSSLEGYLYIALKNRFLRRIMRANLHENALSYLGRRADLMEATVVEMLETSELQTTISTAVRRLPMHMQNIFALRSEDYSIKEIAETLGLAVQTVKTYNMELKRRVKEAILIRHPDISHSLIWIFIVFLPHS